MKWNDDFTQMPFGRVTVRSTDRCEIYESNDPDGDDKHLVALFEGETRIYLRGPYFTVLTNGDFYWLNPAVDQSYSKQYPDVKFTSLDRPSPMSPEMRAIHEMQRRNELERDRFREQVEREAHERIERLRADIGKDRVSTSENKTQPKAAKSVPPSGGESADQPPGEDDSGSPEAGVVHTRGKGTD